MIPAIRNTTKAWFIHVIEEEPHEKRSQKYAAEGQDIRNGHCAGSCLLDRKSLKVKPRERFSAENAMTFTCQPRGKSHPVDSGKGLSFEAAHMDQILLGTKFQSFHLHVLEAFPQGFFQFRPVRVLLAGSYAQRPIGGTLPQSRGSPQRRHSEPVRRSIVPTGGQ